MIYKKLQLEHTGDVWFTSDTHWGHANICKGTTKWDLKQHGGHDSVRDFERLEEMNTAILKGINENVKAEDWLVHLGDWSFGGIENIEKFRDQINCQNIILILGNHDEHIALNKTLPSGRRAQDLFDSVHTYLELTVTKSNIKGKRKFNLMHFPMAIWNKAHHDRIHLHGHTHNSYHTEGRLQDVGIDAAIKVLGEYRPFSMQEVLDIMSKNKYKSFKQKSHHNPHTN